MPGSGRRACAYSHAPTLRRRDALLYTQRRVRRACFSAKSLALLAIAIAPCAFSQGLLGLQSGGGQIHFQAVDELQIEGSHRVRLLPAATRTVSRTKPND